MLKAKDIMTKDVLTISPDTSVEEAAKLLTEKGISGVPVVADGKLLGIVSERDLIMKNKKLDFPDHINILGGIIYLGSHKKFEKEFKKFIAIKVEELMTKEVITLNPDTPVEEIATLMTEEEVNRLPVLDGEKIVGIVTRADLVRHLAK